MFTFVINDTVETSWFAKSHSQDSSKKKDTSDENEPIPINEENLMKVLRGERITKLTKDLFLNLHFVFNMQIILNIPDREIFDMREMPNIGKFWINVLRHLDLK